MPLKELQLELEAAEDKIYNNTKLLGKLEAETAELRQKLAKVEKKQTSLVTENKQLEARVNKQRQLRIQLEEEVDRQMTPLKERRLILTVEIDKLKEQLATAEGPKRPPPIGAIKDQFVPLFLCHFRVASVFLLS